MMLLKMEMVLDLSTKQIKLGHYSQLQYGLKRNGVQTGQNLRKIFIYQR